MASALLDKLKGGDRRSIGRANEVAGLVVTEPSLLAELFQGLEDSDPLIRMRAADAIEKATRQHPQWLRPYKKRLLGEIAACGQQEVQWHSAQMIARLDLDPDEIDVAAGILTAYLRSADSRIVKACALEALADLAERYPALMPKVRGHIEAALQSDLPALAARARKLARARPS